MLQHHTLCHDDADKEYYERYSESAPSKRSVWYGVIKELLISLQIAIPATLSSNECQAQLKLILDLHISVTRQPMDIPFAARALLLRQAIALHLWSLHMAPPSFRL